jgi:hypothetical protein
MLKMKRDKRRKNGLIKKKLKKERKEKRSTCGKAQKCRNNCSRKNLTGRDHFGTEALSG